MAINLSLRVCVVAVCLWPLVLCSVQRSGPCEDSSLQAEVCMSSRPYRTETLKQLLSMEIAYNNIL